MVSASQPLAVDSRGAVGAAGTNVTQARVLGSSVMAVDRIDPRWIVDSCWTRAADVDRSNPGYLRLREAIERAGGNVQPVKVRPQRSVPLGLLDPDRPRFEIVFGHRRTLACSELGLPVLALVEDIDDVQLLQEFTAECGGWKRELPWMLAEAYRRAVDGGLFPSIRRLSEQVGVPLVDVRLLIALAQLPPAIKVAMAGAKLSRQGAKRVVAAFGRDPVAVLTRAMAVQRSGRVLSSRVVPVLLGSTDAELSAGLTGAIATQKE